MTSTTQRAVLSRRGRINVTTHAALAALTVHPLLASTALAADAPLETPVRAYPLDGPLVGTNFSPNGHAVADFNGDGEFDVAHAYQAGAFDFLSTPRFSVSMGLGNGTYADPTFYPTPGGYTYGVAAADLDGDGDIDLAFTQSLVEVGNSVLVVLNDGRGTFGAPQAFSCGQAPQEIIAADFDTDGDPDLITSNWWDDSFTILRNNGAAAFNDRTDVPLVGRPFQLAAADLDGDSALDLVVTFDTGPSMMSVLQNDGFGGFTVGQSLGSMTFSNPRPAVALADVDADGDIDVLRSWGPGGFTPGRFTLYRNDGLGQFGAGVELFSSIPLYGQTFRMNLADATGDGHVDIVATGNRNTDDGWAIIPGDGTGSFGSGEFFYSGEGPDSISIADLNHDGSSDVLITNRHSKTLKVHLQSPGGFDMPAITSVGTQTLRLAAGDIDGDGDEDIVTAHSTTVHSLFNNGDGTFTTVVEPAPLACMQAIRLADLNGDALPDLILARDRNCPPYHLHTMLNDGDGTFGPITTWPLNSAGDNEIAVLDWDNDGDMDIAVSESLGCPSCDHVLLFLLEGNGDGTLQPPVTILDMGSSFRRIEAADMDGDGNMDIVGTAAANGIGIVFGNGDGTFQPIQLVNVVPDAMSSGASWLVIDDLNHDGHPDVAFAGARFDDASVGSVDVVGTLLNDGRGNLIDTDHEWAAFSPNLTIQYGLVTMDVDGDGHRDLLLSTLSAGDVLLFRGSGDGELAPAERYGVNGLVGLPVSADFDSDGSEDVAVVASNFPDAGVSILRSAAAGTPPSADLNNDGAVNAADLALLLGAWNTAAADLNGDGTTNAADLALLLGSWGESA